METCEYPNICTEIYYPFISIVENRHAGKADFVDKIPFRHNRNNVRIYDEYKTHIASVACRSVNCVRLQTQILRNSRYDLDERLLFACASLPRVVHQ